MTFDTDDVIAALASAAGSSARSIVRVSGNGCREVVNAVFTPTDVSAWQTCRVAFRHAGTVRLGTLDVSFSAAACFWPTSRSYTGEPLVELHVPGSPPLVEALLASLFMNGARPARPGEFTLRAFLAGQLDLVQAEAVLGVIDAHDHRELDVALRQLAGGVSGRLADVRNDLLSLLADLEAGLDFVDEDIEFVTRDDVRRRASSAKDVIAALLADVATRSRENDRPRVVLAGLPNAGKSTLFNALCGEDNALVSPVAGTTRDWLTAEVGFSHVSVELVDTAGWETSADDLGAAMQTLRAEQLDRSDLIIWCTSGDASDVELREDQQIRDQLGPLQNRTIFVVTKADLAADAQTSSSVSALTGHGLDALRAQVADELNRERAGARQLVGSTVARGRQSLTAAHDALERMKSAEDLGFGDDVLAAELRSALNGLAAVLGVVYTDDVLDVIFSRFCIGK